MLADPRARWLAEDFAAQWLGYRELEDVTPDVRRFRAFKPALRRDLRLEAEAFFTDLVAEDRSVLEVLDSDHAFLNDRLAAHYGLPPVGHGDLRRTPLADRRRGGVLGMGAILTVTSTPLRTSPVQRGQWVLERLLGRSAPPPPPEVGSLPETAAESDEELYGALMANLSAIKSDGLMHRARRLLATDGLSCIGGLGRGGTDKHTGCQTHCAEQTEPCREVVDHGVGVSVMRDVIAR